MKSTQLLALPLCLLLSLQSGTGLAVTTPISKSPLFNADSVVNLEITSEFQKIRKAAEGGFWGSDGENKEDPRYYAPMTIRDMAHPDRLLIGQNRARGMSSLLKDEVEFPKLRIEIADKEDLKGTLFQGARTFRINAHVNTNPSEEYTRAGRLNSEVVPWRENMAYELARAIGLTTPATRLARIHYIDTGLKKDFTRNAMLLETDKKIAKRIGAKNVEFNDFTEGEKSGLDPVEAAVFLIFHKMIGNGDVGLRVNEKPMGQQNNYRPLFNAMVIEYPNKKRIPVVYDLDFSSMVTGVITEPINNDAFGIKDYLTGRLVFGISSLRQKFTHDTLLKAIAIVESRKKAMYQAVNTATVDEEGRKGALQLLDSYFSNVAKAMAYNVIAQEDVQFYADAKKSASLMKNSIAYGEPGTLRPGTPVVVLGEELGMLKVEILPINQDFKGSGATRTGYIEKGTKISPKVPDELTGKIDYRDSAGYEN